MVEYSDTIVVRAPGAAIWTVLVAVEGWPSWTASVRRVARLSPGELAVESRVRIWQPKMPPLTWTVDQLRPEERFSWTTSRPGVSSFADHRLTPVAEGTRVDLLVRHTGILAGLIDRGYASLTQRYLRFEAEGLQRRVEELDGAR